MPKRMSKPDVHFTGLKSAQALMCCHGVANAKRIAHAAWKWLQAKEKEHKLLNKNLKGRKCKTKTSPGSKQIR